MKFLSVLFLLLFFPYFLLAQGEDLFDDSFLHEIHFQEIDTNIFIGSDNYQLATIIVDGNEVDSVGLKKKGNISASHGNNKFPFKVKTNKYVDGKKYDGIKEFLLHNSFQDPSMMREKMTYDIARELGLYSLRTAFAKVYINGIYWGLYTLIEDKDELYKLIFDNRDGDVMESLDFGDMCYLGAEEANYTIPQIGPRYFVDNGVEETAWPRFIEMLDKANTTAVENYMTVLPSYLNIEDWVRYQAMNVYLLSFDSYLAFQGNQVYYFDEIEDRWQVIPWDFNASFGLWNTNNETPTEYGLYPPKIQFGCIAKNIQDVEVLNEIYLNTICELRTNLLDTLTFNARIENFKSQIQEAVYMDSRKEFENALFDQATSYGYFMAFGENIPALKTFAVDRFSKINSELMAEGLSCGPTSIASENYLNSKLNIYPNPGTTYAHIDWQGDINIRNVKIINSLGQLLGTSQGFEPRLNTVKLNPGVYWIKSELENGEVIVKKWMKIKP